MPFTMSGNNDGWSYNRFDKYEAALRGEMLEEVEQLDEISKKTLGSYVKKASKDLSSRSYSQGEDDAADEEIGLPGQTPRDKKIEKRQAGIGRAVDKLTNEGIDFKGAKRIDDAREAKRKALYKKSPSTKDKDLMMGKFRPAASDEERKSGYRDIMKEKGTQPTKDGKKMFNKEELEATGLFTAEEIEAIFPILEGNIQLDEISDRKVRAVRNAREKQWHKQFGKNGVKDPTDDMVDKVDGLITQRNKRTGSNVSKTKLGQTQDRIRSMRQEALEATGLFTAEEIEALVESNCGDRAYPKGMQKGGRVGYQKGGKVECEKCEGKGCDHCDDKGTHKKEEVKEAAKPDFLDMDGDGDKKEPMKKAIKEKGGKKKDAVVEAALAALDRLVGSSETISEEPISMTLGALAKGAAVAGKAGAAGAKGAAAGGKGLGAMAKGLAKDAAVDAAMDLGGKGVRAVTSLPGKAMDAAKSTVKDTEVEEA